MSTDASTTATREAIVAVRDEVAKAVVGHDRAVTGLLAALLVRGHVLLEGVPGTAKTLLVKALAAALRLDQRRIQFTPDLMPSDVLGQLIYSPGTDGASQGTAHGASQGTAHGASHGTAHGASHGTAHGASHGTAHGASHGTAHGASHGEEATFRFRQGPVFTNLLLADEINRTPPKTQAALLEAMEEHQVSLEGQAHRLPEPFAVIATQNPVEYEGTYPLPEAQVDRFLFKLLVGYPTAEQEQAVVARHNAGMDPHDLAALGIRAVAGPEQLAAARRAVGGVRVEDAVQGYIVAIARATRESPSLTLGVSPRGSVMLLHAAKAWAWLADKPYVTPDEVKTVAAPTLRHRIQLRPEVELEGVTADGVLDRILAAVPVPR